ncbi:MAG: diacylglycerol kinase family lipid kinase [Anaerolineae bacterium]|jgi:YegS/Rv2252/BmrU family lipid kinase
MSTALLIVNPTSGRGAWSRLSAGVKDWLREAGLDFDLVMTEAPGHATQIARQAAERAQRKIIAVGGDGTVNEVLNGMLQADLDPEKTVLGVLPIGTGNDFAVGADLSLKLEDACHVVMGCRTQTLDIGLFRPGEAEPRYFGNGIGVGFDAMANIESRKIKRLRGTLLYLVAVLRTLAFYYDAPQASIQLDDGEIAQPCLMISVMNGRTMGGGFQMTPDSRMDDGLLDLCIAAAVSRPKMISFVPRFLRGTHITDHDITMTQSRRVAIRSVTPWAAQVDGEIYGAGARQFEIELLPQRLRLLH